MLILALAALLHAAPLPTRAPAHPAQITTTRTAAAASWRDAWDMIWRDLTGKPRRHWLNAPCS